MEQIIRKKVNDDEIVCRYVNTETGVIDYELRVGDTIGIDTKEKKDYRANHRKIKSNNTFVKVFKDVIPILLDEDLNKSDYVVIFVSLKYLDMLTGILTEDGVNISKSRFMELTELSHNTFNSSISKLIKLEIIARKKVKRNSVYMLNPFIFLNGKEINAELYAIFKKSKWNTQND